MTPGSRPMRWARALPGYAECGPPRTGKYVGIFYFLWLGEHGTGGPYDITKLLAANPTNPAWGPAGAFHHWGESELGYYLSSDDYVIRKHAHMLVDAGVDVLIFDVTNGLTYKSNYLKLCQIYTQIRAEGGNDAADLLHGQHRLRERGASASMTTSTRRTCIPISGSTGRESRSYWPTLSGHSSHGPGLLHYAILLDVDVSRL